MPSVLRSWLMTCSSACASQLDTFIAEFFRQKADAIMPSFIDSRSTMQTTNTTGQTRARKKVARSPPPGVQPNSKKRTIQHHVPTMMQQQDEAEFPTGVTSVTELDTRSAVSAGLYENMAGPDIVGFEGNSTSCQCSGDSSVEMLNPAIQLDVPVPPGFTWQVSHDAFAPTGDPSVMLAYTSKDTPTIQFLENTTDLQNIRGIKEPFSL